MGRWRDERHFADVVIPTRNSEQPDIMHGKEDQVGTEERTPEMELAELVVQHPPRALGVPMIDPPQHNQYWRHAHPHMEMRDDEHSIRKRDIPDNVAEEEAGEPAVHE